MLPACVSVRLRSRALSCHSGGLTWHTVFAGRVAFWGHSVKCFPTADSHRPTEDGGETEGRETGCTSETHSTRPERQEPFLQLAGALYRSRRRCAPRLKVKMLLEQTSQESQRKNSKGRLIPTTKCCPVLPWISPVHPHPNGHHKLTASVWLRRSSRSYVGCQKTGGNHAGAHVEARCPKLTRPDPYTERRQMQQHKSKHHALLGYPHVTLSD